jgi:hypothetical protein
MKDATFRAISLIMSAGKYLTLKLKPDIQAVYMAGMIDGMYLAPMFDAIVTKYVKKRPDEWRAGANVVAYQALREVCPAI